MDKKEATGEVASKKEEKGLPSQCRGRLVLCDARFEEVFLLTEVDGFAHPREWVLRAVEGFEADALEAAVGDILDIFAEHRGGQAENAAGQAVFRILDLEFDGNFDLLDDLSLELR